MWFSRKQADQLPTQDVAGGAATAPKQVTTKSRGDAAEAAAQAWLSKAGLRWVESNYRTPGRGGGEIDLIMRAPDGTLVFVEVRQRANASHGGAGASISSTKQRRIIFAARHYLMRFASAPPCRFDVVLVHGALCAGKGPGPEIEWLPAAFDAS
ncbi:MULTISPECIES: YraN family protein [unclassified Polaromonas]|uniref:YraN family protein n=1 Tax=unclassified Polaromonas TaxID=2638319 RepID=UPI0018C9ABC4|nr:MULTISPECIES: YraN family protein [unclassified Polaromonas]MBG6072320.1 putative endonuclease [Polaromonas sp. CG_9.7]MBG6114249.1 putative endonuclease [Polaromonas sp. CG_9.2]MDH6182793.1 putative endonuclease [Polaromonas sp. CG_23.6]